MGNTHISACVPTKQHQPPAKLIFPDGETRTATCDGGRRAGEIMFQFPDSMLCHAGSFYMGRPLPSLAVDDELVSGETYLVLPIDRCTSTVLSLASLAALGGSGFKACMAYLTHAFPFEYRKGDNGRMLMKVLPGFLERLVVGMEGKDWAVEVGGARRAAPLCSTPELQKRYERLVGCGKVQVWSPRLETIAEDSWKKRGRFSCSRFF